MVTLSDDVKIHQHESKLTIRDTLRGMTISEMIKYHGVKRSSVHTIVDLQLVRFLNSINISTPLTDFQKTELVMTMVERYPHETLNDFLLCFRMVKHGYFGPIYNRLDITVISEYMTKYLEMKAFEREHEQQEFEQKFIAENEKHNFTSLEQYLEHKEKWYKERLELREKLNAIDERYERIKKRGSVGVVGDDPKKEADYQQWRSEWLKTNGEKNDLHAGGTMEGNVDPGTDENVSVSGHGGSGNADTIPSPGSEHSQQGDGLSQ